MSTPIGPEVVIVHHEYPYFLADPIIPGTTIFWTVTKGHIVSGQGTSQVVILWDEVGDGSIQTTVTHPGQEPDIDSITVVVDPEHITEN
jgi:hypothetical protein